MRRRPDFVNDLDRVLWVLDGTPGWMRQADIIKEARMAQATAIETLKLLIAQGRVEWSKLYRGSGGGSGAPAYIYRRRVARTEAA